MQDYFNEQLHGIMVRDLPGVAANLCRAMREFPSDHATRDPDAGLQSFDTYWGECVGAHIVPSGCNTLGTMFATLATVFRLADFITTNSSWLNKEVNSKPPSNPENVTFSLNKRPADISASSTYTDAGFVFSQRTVNSLTRDTLEFDESKTSVPSGADFYDVCRWLSKKDFTGAFWTIVTFKESLAWASLPTTPQGVSNDYMFDFKAAVTNVVNRIDEWVFSPMLDIYHKIRDIAAIGSSDYDAPEFLNSSPWGIDTSKTGWTAIPNITAPCFSFKLPGGSRYQLLIQLPEVKDYGSSPNWVRRNVCLEHIDIGYTEDGVFHGNELGTSETQNHSNQTTINLLSDLFTLDDKTDTVVFKFMDAGGVVNGSKGPVCDHGTPPKFSNSKYNGTTYSFKPAWAKVFVRRVGSKADKEISVPSLTIEDSNGVKFTGGSSDPLNNPMLVGPTVEPLTSDDFVGYRNVTSAASGSQIWRYTKQDVDASAFSQATLSNDEDIKCQGLMFHVYPPDVAFSGALKIRTKWPYVLMSATYLDSFVFANQGNPASKQIDIVTGKPFVKPFNVEQENPFVNGTDVTATVIEQIVCENASWPIKLQICHINDVFTAIYQRLNLIDGEYVAPIISSDDVTNKPYVEETMTLKDLMDKYEEIKSIKSFKVRVNESSYAVYNDKPAIVHKLTNPTKLIEATSKYSIEDMVKAVFSELVWFHK